VESYVRVPKKKSWLKHFKSTLHIVGRKVSLSIFPSFQMTGTPRQPVPPSRRKSSSRAPPIVRPSVPPPAPPSAGPPPTVQPDLHPGQTKRPSLTSNQLDLANQPDPSLLMLPVQSRRPSAVNRPVPPPNQPTRSRPVPPPLPPGPPLRPAPSVPSTSLPTDHKTRPLPARPSLPARPPVPNRPAPPPGLAAMGPVSLPPSSCPPPLPHEPPPAMSRPFPRIFPTCGKEGEARSSDPPTLCKGLNPSVLLGTGDTTTIVDCDESDDHRLPPGDGSDKHRPSLPHTSLHGESSASESFEETTENSSSVAELPADELAKSVLLHSGKKGPLLSA
jgi:hypothetical protein